MVRDVVMAAIFVYISVSISTIFCLFVTSSHSFMLHLVSLLSPHPFFCSFVFPFPLSLSSYASPFISSLTPSLITSPHPVHFFTHSFLYSTLFFNLFSTNPLFSPPLLPFYLFTHSTLFITTHHTTLFSTTHSQAWLQQGMRSPHDPSSLSQAGSGKGVHSVDSNQEQRYAIPPFVLAYVWFDLFLLLFSYSFLYSFLYLFFFINIS
jgi:hypothetical protein